MLGSDAKAVAALTAMAKASGTDLAGFRAQLATTRMFATPAEAHTFLLSPQLAQTSDLVRRFSFDHGILGEGAKSVDAVGIAFPDGKTLGDPKNVKHALRCELHEDGARREALTSAPGEAPCAGW